MDSFDQMNSSLISSNIDLQVQDQCGHWHLTKGRSLKKNKSQLVATNVGCYTNVILLSDVKNTVDNVMKLKLQILNDGYRNIKLMI